MRGHIGKRRGTWFILYKEAQEDGATRQRWRGGFRTKQEAEGALSLLQDTLRPRGRPPRTDEEYLRIAQLYHAKFAARTEANRSTAGIVAEIAAEEGKPPSTMRAWLAGARKRGFLG